jgi:hypothetical protein
MLTPAQTKKARLSIVGQGQRITKNLGTHTRRILIGIPTLGVIRYEWHMHDKGQTIPINWQAGSVTVTHYPESIAGIGFQVADAQNIVVDAAVKDHYEWMLLYEDDVLPPFDAYMRLAQHMEAGTCPIVSGLYYSKGSPSWPLLFRGRGNGSFTDFTIGKPVWVDGVPTGFLLIHSSIFKHMWQESPAYQLPDGKKVRQVFKTPRESWYDPELERYFAKMGTSDLFFCDRLIDQKILAKTGWTALAKQKYPFLVDTRIYCQQIDLNGVLYPNGAAERLLTTGEKRRRA